MASVYPLDVVQAHGSVGLALLVREVDKLVSMPDIYYRLEELIVEPASTTDTISDLLRSDPDLCARMLRVANSAFYSFPTRIETIERAVGTIGLRQIRELVLMTSVVKAFDGFPDGSVNMETFWEHSIAVGVTARALGEYRALPNASSFYIPGLLHDIGRLVMVLKLPGLMHDLLDRRSHSGETLFALEQQSLGYTHADIGALLLENWNVPESIWQPVRAHHDPQNGGEYVVTACAIHIADAWVNTNRSGSSGGKFSVDIETSALQTMGIDKQDLDLIGRSAGVETMALVRQFMAH